MKKKLLLLGILFLVFAGIIAFRFFVYDTQNAVGQLKIVSSPSAQVFIDNNLVGKTPYENKHKVGEYLVKLVPEGSSGEASAVQVKVMVHKSALTYVNRELGASDVETAGEVFTITKMESAPSNKDAGEISVETDPNGAIVYLDNDEKGVAPLLLADVMRGNHELSVFMPGMFRRTHKINVDAGYRVNAVLKLAVDASQQPEEQASGEADLTDESKEESTADEKKESTKSGTITIKDTPTGFLRVREDATTSASESAQVKPGDTFEVLDTKNGWFKIEYEKGAEGWVSGSYVTEE